MRLAVNAAVADDYAWDSRCTFCIYPFSPPRHTQERSIRSLGSMRMTRRKLVGWAFVIADSAVLGVSLYVAATWFTVPLAPLRARDIPPVQPRLLDIAIAATILVVWMLVFKHFGLYRERHLSFMRFRHYHFIDLVKATSLGALFLLGASFLADLRQVTAGSVLVFWASSTVGTLLTREVLIRLLQQMRLRGRNLRHLLIIGTNVRAQAFAKKIENQPELGYALRGFVDDDWKGSAHTNSHGSEVVAGLDTIGEYVINHVVDEVLITLPIATFYQEASRIVKICQNHGIVVHFLPGFDFLNIGSSAAILKTLEEEPVITLLPPPMRGWQLAAKRTIDVVGTTILIILLGPVFALVAVLIKLTSKGPIFFVQNRVGLNKRKFLMLKFRTMVNNAEELQKTLEHLNEASGPVFKMENDPRITPLGSLLRRTSLDELPQLFNVLRGDMSLVGPRPLPLRDYAGFDQDWHRRRFSVRPGITCLWQVRGRSSISFERWMELDMEYINNWSLWLDLKILMQTVPAILAQRGAR